MNIKDAIAQVKKESKAKFDSTIELHVNLDLDIQKDGGVRFTVVLPHGTGKSQKIAVLASKSIKNADLELTESDVDRLEKGGLKPKVDFDILIVEPRFMPKLAKAAKILGPAGCMPNPKNGTVTEDVEKSVELFKKGRVEIRTEANFPIIHTIIGKKSFDNAKLEENLTEVLSALTSNKPSKVTPEWIKSIYLSSSMGPSVVVTL